MLMGPHAHFHLADAPLNYYTPVTIRDLIVRKNGLAPERIVTEGSISRITSVRREMLHKADDGMAEVADVLQFLANAGGYGKNLRVIARK
jgi:hypothetical protein